MNCLRDHRGRFLPHAPDDFDPRFWPEPLPYRAIYLDDRGERFALVDTEDYEAAARFTWSLHSDGRSKLYARRSVTVNGKRSRVYLHRFIMERVAPQPCAEKFLVDHLGGDGLDCRRKMLRWASPKENSGNLYGFYWKQLSLLQRGTS